MNDFLIDRVKLLMGAESFGLTLNDNQLEQFQLYAQYLLDWNQKFNLTRVPAEEIVSRHFLDSLSGVKGTSFDRVETLLDVGTGAGFPGLPLKIAFPHLRIGLLDSTQKRLRFLRAVGDELKLNNLRFIDLRAEDAGRLELFRESYDCVVARAVAELNVLAELVLPFVKVSGIAILYKGSDIDEEVQQSSHAISQLGASLEQVIDLSIPPDNSQRKLVVLRKTQRISPNYPRPFRNIEKNPL